MPILLIATVGGASEPVAAGILYLKPARVLFVCSPETRSMVDLPNPPDGRSPGILQILRANGYELDSNSFEFLDVPDAQELEGIVAAIRREAALEVQRWLARGEDREVVVDFTGGTKCMSAALVLAARQWNCRLQYIGGTVRTKGGVGVVIGGREQVLHQRNPWQTLAYETVERVVTLFDSSNPAAALLEVSDALKVTGGAPKSGLASLRALCAAYAAWDRFDHKSASEEATRFLNAPYNLAIFWQPAAIERLVNVVKTHDAHLRKVSTVAGASLEVVADLRQNAERRMDEGRFDDAVARYYRLVEAYGQYRLSTHGFPSTAEVPIDRIPEPFRQIWAADATDGRLKLALQRTYQLLSALGDEAAVRFARAGLDDPERSPLSLRNQSILAHGFHPVTERSARALQNAVAVLLEGDPTGPSLSFPVLSEMMTG